MKRLISWLSAGATAAVRGLFVAHEIIVRKRTSAGKSSNMATELRDGHKRPPTDQEAR